MRMGLGLILMGLLLAGCGAEDTGLKWSGTVDTLSSGQVVVGNPATPLWRAGEEWRLTEDLRVGTVEGDGPDLFGQINSISVDPLGRIWVLEGQAQEIRVFDADGAFVRTVGRRGGGPGEFAQAVRLDLGPDGHMWVADPNNNRVSLFDTAGTYLEGKSMKGGFVMLPWPGRFDDEGHYYLPVPDFGSGAFSISLVRHDLTLAALDTLIVPRDPVERDMFAIKDEEGRTRVAAGIPFQGSLTSRLSRAGTIWALITDQYRLFELSARGDTLRTILREFHPLAVTEADREEAGERLEWFIKQGGQVDWSKIPDTKPLVTGFFQDDEANLWVRRTSPSLDTTREFDIFDPDGRYLGVVTAPFPLAHYDPVIREGLLYGLVRDELDVPYVVRVRVGKSGRAVSG